ncbi:MAG: ABC transporter ATP-binding protein [Candidatus Eisenbacteria bacterium]|uniref:ABC transporter ATP-binding protein n=1 Tax=Eiseniibacteriota bacterium TaxID=2212470 RepID=A0A849SPS8_UNCEI|nr:ABC transporter ATP-binding protein [Candidatus Eisenbacteria bacterium]
MQKRTARLHAYLARHRGGLAWGVACVLIANAIVVAQPQVLRFAVDDLYQGVTAQKLGRYALTLFGVALLGGIFKYFMRQVVIGISRRIEYDLRNDLFEHLQRLPASYYQDTRIGEIMARATNDMSAVRMMMGPGIMYFVNTVAVGVASIVLMFAISPRVTFYTLLPLPLVSFSVWFFGERIHRRFESIQAHFARIAAHVQENLSGLRVVRAFALERVQHADFLRLNREYLDRNVALIRTSGAFYPALSFLSGVAALLALFLGGREVIKDRISLGEFVAFTWYLGMLNWPVVALGWVISLWQRGLASWGRIDEILSADASIRTAPNARKPEGRASGEIVIRNLTFTYPGAREPALSNLSLDVPAGSTLAIVGRTGSGKSSLIQLLPRVFDAPRGTVFLDGIDVLDLDLQWLRAQIAYVPQETFLFSATLAENVAFGVDHATAAEIERVGAIAHLSPDVERFPKRWETRVGERGITLSGGQKQRTAIARALLRDSPVLLLDDCLSSVDTHTEHEILHGLEGEMRKRTALIVSHRVSAVRDADEIVVLDHGAVVERGTHDALLTRGGRYAELQRVEQLEEEIEAS